MQERLTNGPSQRCLKVGEEVRRLLSAIFQNYFFEDRTLSSTSITVTEVQMSPDLKHAKVFLMPLGGVSKAHVLPAIQSESGKIRHFLSKKIYLKSVPVLDFRIDETFDTYASLSESLDRVL